MKMDMLPYSLTALIAFSGIFAGRALAHFSQEEMAAGKKHFLLLHKIILAAIAVLLANAFGIGFVSRAVIYAVVIIALFLVKKTRSELIYPSLGAMFFLGSKTGYFVEVSSLIFIYGFPAGSLISKKQGFAKMLLYHSPFLAVALALYVFF